MYTYLFKGKLILLQIVDEFGFFKVILLLGQLARLAVRKYS